MDGWDFTALFTLFLGTCIGSALGQLIACKLWGPW